MTRVQIPAYTDRWMMGDRYGEIVRTYWGRTSAPIEIAAVKLDKSGVVRHYALADCEVVS
jgi:hypothetical protein